MERKTKIIAICNQKGGVGKTVTAVSLGIGLARAGKKVLLVDVDAQGSLTASLGYQHPDQMKDTLAEILGRIITDKPVTPGEGILHQTEGVDLVPAKEPLVKSARAICERFCVRNRRENAGILCVFQV